VLELYPKMDIVVKAAAVADYRPAELAPQKIKKGSATLRLSLTRTDDILELLGKQKKNQVLVGFAAETEHLLESAKAKLTRKNLDLLVANDVSKGVFGSDTSSVFVIDRKGETVTLPQQSKQAIAGKILDMALAVRNKTYHTEKE
jgi:phosphopantothenoylcysteine decarboxylase / phosphopantothenate---cysteine ligase